MVVQDVLNKKETQAQYTLNGFSVPNRKIDVSTYINKAYINYTLTDSDIGSIIDDIYANQSCSVKIHKESILDGAEYTVQNYRLVYQQDEFNFKCAEKVVPVGQNLEADMDRAAHDHFGDDYTITGIDMDYEFPMYTFKTSYNPDSTFVVYLNGTVPYIAYAESTGATQMQMHYYSKITELDKYFTDDEWSRFSPFIREDEYNNSNVLLNGLESEEERLSIYQELIELATKELKTLSQPSLEFTMNMANILAIPEFKPLISRFELGNFIRVELREGIVKRARLTEVDMSLNDWSDFSCTFGNLVVTQDEIDLHAELLSQAVQAGKQVATSAGTWQKAADKTNRLEQSINNGLQDTTLAIGKTSGQAISWDSNGMHFRKYKDGSDSEFEPEEMAIINNALVATNDSWRTSKAAFGKYTVNGETRWGPIAEYITADTIEGKSIFGGTIQIGTGDTKFVVNEDGSVEIRSQGQSVYASDISAIKSAFEFTTQLVYSGQTVFSDQSNTCTITCKVYHLNKTTGVTDDITNDVVLQAGSVFTWNGLNGYTEVSKNSVIINHSNIDQYAEITCQVDFDESPWNT